MEIIIWIVLFVIGLIILIKGSDFFVGSAAFVARHFGISELIIGLTLVSMGTSLPELGASVYASYTSEGEIAVGNVIGSNIANIALVLGACLMLCAMAVRKVKRDALIMLGVTLLFIFFILDGVQQWEGLVLMILFVIYIFYLYKLTKHENHKNNIKKNTHPEKKEKGLGKEIAKLVAGCIGVFLGAKLLVDSAVYFSTEFGISESVIGSTLIAFGTSVPELAVSLTAIMKKHEEISIGNIIGSNIFNILLVTGAAAMVGSLAVDNQLLFINGPIMLSVACLLVLFLFIGKGLKRWQGGVFAAIYIMFLVVNFW